MTIDTFKNIAPITPILLSASICAFGVLVMKWIVLWYKIPPEIAETYIYRLKRPLGTLILLFSGAGLSNPFAHIKPINFIGHIVYTVFFGFFGLVFLSGLFDKSRPIFYITATAITILAFVACILAIRLLHQFYKLARQLNKH